MANSQSTGEDNDGGKQTPPAPDGDAPAAMTPEQVQLIVDQLLRDEAARRYLDGQLQSHALTAISGWWANARKVAGIVSLAGAGPIIALIAGWYFVIFDRKSVVEDVRAIVTADVNKKIDTSQDELFSSKVAQIEEIKALYRSARDDHSNFQRNIGSLSEVSEALGINPENIKQVRDWVGEYQNTADDLEQSIRHIQTRIAIIADMEQSLLESLNSSNGDFVKKYEAFVATISSELLREGVKTDAIMSFLPAGFTYVSPSTSGCAAPFEIVDRIEIFSIPERLSRVANFARDICDIREDIAAISHYIPELSHRALDDPDQDGHLATLRALQTLAQSCNDEAREIQTIADDMRRPNPRSYVICRMSAGVP